TLRPLHEDDEGDHGDGHHQDQDDEPGRERALAAKFEGADDRGRQLRHDACKDDQRDAVADATRGDLLPQPHQKHRAAGERDHGPDAEEPARIGDHAAGALEAHGNAVRLKAREHHREVARVLVHDLAALLALFLELFERGRDRRHQLDDDRRRDVRHDVQRKDRHAVDATAGEHVEHAEDAAGLRAEDLVPGRRIDTGQRDIGAEAVDQQRAEREPDALFELFGLGEGREVEIGGELFCCRDHGLELPFRPPRNVPLGAPTDLYRHQAGCSPASRLGARTVTEPPAFSTAATADLDAPHTVNATLALISPVPSNRTPSLARLSTPAFTKASASTGAPESSLPASIAACTRCRLISFSLSANAPFLKPRLGSRRWSGIWPPSKPLMRTPERAVWPLPPRPPVLPVPEPMPR